MPDRKYRRSRAEHGVGRQQAAQEATRTREQVAQIMAEPELWILKDEKSKRQPITLEDGSVVDADLAANLWESLEDFLKTERPEFFQSLLAMAQGRHSDADPRHFETLEAYTFVTNDHSIDPAVRDVLLNSYTATGEGAVIAPLRLKTAADAAVAEEALAQLHQDFKEGHARMHRPGGWWENQPWNKGGGRSRD